MVTAKFLQSSQLFIAKYWRGVFIVMLALLHLAAMRGAGDFWARGLMLAHFGLFIMWQPFMRGERHLSPAHLVAIIGIAVCIFYFLNWWLLALWVSVLAGV